LKNIDNIEDWYKNELNNYNVKPDESVWDSLSDDLNTDTPLTDENISDWYKKEVNKLEERPDYTVWEKLSTKLDTTTVWDKLAISLNRYDQMIWWRNMAFRGTAILLFTFGSYLAYNNYVKDKPVLAENSKTKKSIIYNNATPITNNKKIAVHSNNSTKSNKPNNNDLNTSIVEKNDGISNKTSIEKEIESAISESKKKITSPSKHGGRSKENTSYASMKKIQDYYSSIYLNNLDDLKTGEERTIITETNRHQLTERDITHLYSEGEFLVKKNNDKIVFNSKRFSSYFMFGVYARRIYVGFNAGFKKQGMINQVKENSGLADYKQDDLLDFGSNFGGTVGFIVSDKFNVEANINLNSTAGYKRKFNSEGNSYKENLNLNYTSVSLLAKKMNNKSTFDNKVYSTNIIGGIYVSYLRSAVSNINGVSKNLNEYNNTDLGIVLGVEQDRYITKTLVITPGIRYNQGLTNIANDNSSFESSRNFSFEFNLGVKYIFLKKGK